MNNNNINIYIGRLLSILLNIFVALFSFSCIFPIVWLIYSSLKTEKEFNLNIISLPVIPQFKNYINALKLGNMQIYFLNSLFNSIISVFFIVVIGFITGYLLSRFKFKGRNLLYMIFLSGMLIPPVPSLLIPEFLQFKVLGLLDKRITLILPYIAFGLPIAIFLIVSFVKTVPIEIEEAAILDGCNITTRMMKIVMPMCWPVISTVLILSFLNSWNEFPFALTLIRSEGLLTIPVGLTNFYGQFTVNYPQLMAAMVIAIIPVILIYLLFSKKVVQGMIAGAVKG